jgi:chromosome segregation ATPase
MPSEDVRDREDGSGGLPIGPATQRALVEAVPDLLLLLADTREQLERVRAEVVEVTARAEGTEQAERQLRQMVSELQDELERATVTATSLRSEIDDARSDLVLSGDELARTTEILLNTGARAQRAEAQLDEIRSSTAWRLTSPLRRLAARSKR